MLLHALFDVIFKTSKRQVVIGLNRKANIGLLILELRFHFSLTWDLHNVFVSNLCFTLGCIYFQIYCNRPTLCN